MPSRFETLRCEERRVALHGRHPFLNLPAQKYFLIIKIYKSVDPLCSIFVPFSAQWSTTGCFLWLPNYWREAGRREVVTVILMQPQRRKCPLSMTLRANEAWRYLILAVESLFEDLSVLIGTSVFEIPDRPHHFRRHSRDFYGITVFGHCILWRN